MDWKLFYKSYFILLLAFFLQLLISLCVNNFQFAYALDDPYIHLAIAKNFAQYGVWGVTKFEFSSSSSSLLYTLIISFFYFIGLKSLYIPLILNVISLWLFVYSLIEIFDYLSLKRRFLSSLIIIIGLFTPAIALMLSGMEHIAHISLILLLFKFTLRYLKRQKSNDLYKVLLLIVLSVGIRFESLFVAFAIGLILLFKKDLKAFFLVGLFSAFPVVVFGIISLSNGGYFLPNTLLVKGVSPENNIDSIINQSILWLERAITYPHLLSAILITVIGIFYSREFNQKKLFHLSVIVLVSWILHLTFAGVGWFYRYEAYLLVASLVILAKLYNEILINPKIVFSSKKVIVIIIILMLPLTYRLVSSVYKSTYAIQNIYNQQVRMAKIINDKGYKSVILNDIGAVCYYNDIRVIDVLGLGSVEVVEAIRQRNYNQEKLIELSKKKGCEVAFLYKNILDFSLPNSWKLIDSIKIKNNVVCWSDVVYEYEINNNISLEK